MRDYSILSKEELNEQLETIDDDIRVLEEEIHHKLAEIDELESDIEICKDEIGALGNERRVIETILNDINEREKPDPNQLNML